MTQNINIGFFDNISYDFANIYETDKVICFTQPKVGSRTLDTLWKDKNYSAIHDVPKIDDSQYVYKRVLEDNHRHVAIDEVFEMLNGM